jgi:hypothetical protein
VAVAGNSAANAALAARSNLEAVRVFEFGLIWDSSSLDVVPTRFNGRSGRPIPPLSFL